MFLSCLCRKRSVGPPRKRSVGPRGWPPFGREDSPLGMCSPSRIRGPLGREDAGVKLSDRLSQFWIDHEPCCGEGREPMSVELDEAREAGSLALSLSCPTCGSSIVETMPTEEVLKGWTREDFRLFAEDQDQWRRKVTREIGRGLQRGRERGVRH